MAEFWLNAAQQAELMREALDEAERGLAEGEAPVGCVIARREGDGARIVARGHNRNVATHRKIAHAEMVAFDDGADSGKLDPEARDLVLVSTLEPCVMCLGAAIQSGVRWIVYGLRAPADGGTPRVMGIFTPDATDPVIVGGVRARECRALFERYARAAGRDADPYVAQLLMLTDETGDQRAPMPPLGMAARPA